MGNFWSLDHHMSACTIYKPNMKGIGYFLDDVEVTYEEHEERKQRPAMFFLQPRKALNSTVLSFVMQ